MYKIFLIITVCLVAAAAARAYDSNDFATTVVEYVPGTGMDYDYVSGKAMNDPNAALGRPTLVTTGDGWDIPSNQQVPVVPVFPPFRSFEICTIGNGGHLTLKFNHHVAHDKNNPYGIDLIVFGNANEIIPVNGNGPWVNGSPETVLVSATIHKEPGKVSVSKDGQTWYTFTSGPYADDFAPTASYKWDSANHRWGAELDPTLPVDPNLTPAMVAGKTVAQMIDMYNGSAGGTGFNIATLGLDWIQYVRIDGSTDPQNFLFPDIDAVADVSACGDYKHPFPPGDVNQDCRVNMVDFALMCQHWLDCTWKCN